MNIGIVSPQLSSYGGSEIYLLECLKRWQRSADVTVYTPSFNEKLFEEFEITAKVEVRPLLAPRTRHRRFDLLYESLILPRLWEQQIEKHDLYFLYLFPTQIIQRRPSVWFAAEPPRMLYDLRNYSNHNGGQTAVHLYPRASYSQIRVSDLEVMLQIIEEFDSNPRFDRLVTNSRMTAQYLENISGRNADLIAYPGIQLPAQAPPPSSFDKVLYVGRLWHHKRVELIIKAMALTKSPNELIIVGDGPEKARLKRLASSLGLKRSVHFVGDVSMGERAQLYRECTCCVYVPVREPFGMVPLEAAAAGRPVVATVGGGYSEVLTREAACFVPAHEGAIAEAIHGFMSNPARAMKMGGVGRSIVGQYTWDRTADTLMDLFKETVGGGTGRRRRVIGRKKPNEEEKSSPPKIQLGAHYYPWYRTGKKMVHWNENSEYAGVTDAPMAGPYSSHERATIRRHLRFARTSGLDFFIINLHVEFRGLNPAEIEAAQRLFKEVEKSNHPIKLAILLGLYTEDPGIVTRALRQVKSDFLRQPAYLRHQGQPVLWYYFNDSLQGLLFYHYRKIAALHRNVLPVATGSLAYRKFMPQLLRRFFHGWSFYSPLEVGPRVIWERIWKESYRDFIEDDGKLNLFTISPGYDDSHLTEENRSKKATRRIPRMGLKTYERMQKAALDLDPAPHYVVVTSFNEFHENTHIEPSEKYGDLYLRSTRAFKDKLGA